MPRKDWIDPLDMTGLELVEFSERYGRLPFGTSMYVKMYDIAHGMSDMAAAEAMEWAVDNRARHRLRGTLSKKSLIKRLVDRVRYF